MKVRELIQKLAQCDPEAEVLMHCREEAGVASNVVRNGDALYFAGDGLHGSQEWEHPRYVYVTDKATRWLDGDADAV